MHFMSTVSCCRNCEMSRHSLASQTKTKSNDKEEMWSSSSNVVSCDTDNSVNGYTTNEYRICQSPLCCNPHAISYNSSDLARCTTTTTSTNTHKCTTARQAPCLRGQMRLCLLVAMTTLLLAPSVCAFSEEIFERHAHNKHKAFAQGASTWIANSEDECLYR